MPARAKLTEADRRDVLACYCEQQDSIRTIARRKCVSYETIRRVLIAHGVARRKRGTPAGMRRAFRRTVRTNRRERVPTPAEIARATARIRANWSPQTEAARRAYCSTVTWTPPVVSQHDR